MNTKPEYSASEHQEEALGPEGLRFVLNRLERLTHRLKILSIYIVFPTLVSIVIILFIGGGSPLLRILGRTQLLTFGLTCNLFAIVAAFLFDSQVNRGNVLFKEASDELQWYVRFGENAIKTEESSLPLPSARPEIRTRVVLREFATSTRLPLLSSSASGPAFYLAVNLGIAVGSVLLARLT